MTFVINNYYANGFLNNLKSIQGIFVFDNYPYASTNLCIQNDFQVNMYIWTICYIYSFNHASSISYIELCYNRLTIYLETCTTNFFQHVIFLKFNDSFVY